MDKGDQFAADPAKEPSVSQVLAGIHRGACYQQQQVSQSQARDEQVWHISHGLDCTEDLDQGDVANEAYHDDNPINCRNDINDSRVEPVVHLGGIQTLIEGVVAVQERVHFQVQVGTIVQSHLKTSLLKSTFKMLLLNF